MDYTRFINNISENETHHGKFLLHYVNYKTLDEELRLYRFADFIKIAREDLKKYEDFELKDNILYNFQLFIHAPDKEKSSLNIRQHSTTMTLLYRIFGGHDIPVRKGEKIRVVVYDHTRFDSDLKISSTYTIIKNPKKLFRFKEYDIIKVLENTGRIKTLTIVKSHQVPYFNFSTNNIIPTDKWNIPKELQTTMHHSVSYIVNRNLYYKFPDDSKHQFINFAVYLYNKNKFERSIESKSSKMNEKTKKSSESRASRTKSEGELSKVGDSQAPKQEMKNKNAVYHKCMLDPETSKFIEHYNGKCCVGSKSTIVKYETKSIIENPDIQLKTIKHYYLNEDFSRYDLSTNLSMKELQKICNIQKYLRTSFMDQNNILIKYINTLAEKSASHVHVRG